MELQFELDPALDHSLRDALIDLWLDVNNADGAVGFVPPVAREQLEPFAHSAFDAVGRGESHVVVAFENRRPVGMAFLIGRPGPLFRHWQTIKRLMVHPSLQGRGVGSALLRDIHDKARELGLEQLHLTVRGGTGTESFYKRHGYELVATIPKVIRLAPDDDRDEIYMIARL